jgi:hypothetical protein
VRCRFPYLQLNLLPRLSRLTRLLVEPLALQSARMLESREEHSCRFLSFVFSADSLAGSNCVLLLRRLVIPVVHFFSALLGFRFNSDFQSSSCKSCAVHIFVLNISALLLKKL